jgi:hypothetical protein
MSTIQRIPNTALKNARRPDGRKVISWLSDPVTGADQIWPQNAGSIMEHSIMRAESGGCVGTVNGRKVFCVCGGGHGDGAHFGLYGLLLPGETPQPDDWTWVCLIEHPQLFNGQQNWPSGVSVGTTYNPDGSPVSRHTWNGICWLPEPYNRVLVALGSTWPTGFGDPLRLSWRGNLEAGVWEQSHPFKNPGVAAITAGLHFYPPNKAIWIYQHNIMQHDLDTGGDVKLNGSESIDNKVHSFIDYENKLLYLHYWSPPYMKVFDLQAIGSKCQSMTVSGDLTGLSVYRPGTWFSPKHGHVLWVGGNDLYIGKRTGMNMHYEKVSFSGDIAPPKVTQGMYGKFNKLDPDGDTFIIGTEVSNDVYIGTMPSGDPPDTTAPQAPTLTAQPAVWS